MKPTTFDEITVGEVLIWLNKLEKLESDATKVVMVKQLLTRQLSLIQTTIRECMVEKRRIVDYPLGIKGDGYKYGFDDGFNQAIDTITCNLQKKGLL